MGIAGVPVRAAPEAIIPYAPTGCAASILPVLTRCLEPDITVTAGDDPIVRVVGEIDAAAGCGLRTDGTVQCWGGNDWNDDYVGMSDPPSGTFTAMGAGALHSCGVRTDGTIECWGDNTYGQTDAPAGTFVAVDSGSLITSQHAITCALRADGTVACWGFET